MKSVHTAILTSALSILVAACGASAVPSSGVVTLESPAASGGPASSAASPGDEGYAQMLLGYARCMRDHGVANFPDPEVSGGNARLPSLDALGIDKGSPTFQSANAACQSAMPTPPPQARQPMSPQDQAKWLQFSACMRAHGVPKWPDPDFSNGGPKPQFNLAGTGLEGQDAAAAAAAQAAQDACRPLLPALAGGSAGSAGSAPSSPAATSPAPAAAGSGGPASASPSPSAAGQP